MSDKKKITEKEGLQNDWYARARKMTADDLPKFISELIGEYEHDYGTICHAVAAAALAGAYSVENSPTGGITGFQSGAVMWEFISEWQQLRGKPMRLIDYSDMLFPQYADKFDKHVSEDTRDWLVKEANAHLFELGEHATPAVVRHLEKIAAGNLPFGYTVSEDM